MISKWKNRRKRQIKRCDLLTAQRIDVGLVFLEMLGEADAVACLAQSQVPPSVASRVLSDRGGRRREGDCWLSDN